MADCFDGIISYKGGCASVSGLLLDELIPIKEVEQYVGEDYDTAAELIEDKIEFAVKNVVAEIGSHFASSYIPRTILSDKRAGFIAETQTEKPQATDTYRGIELRICNKESYFSMYVSSIDTYLNYTGALNILVIDTMTGTTLDTIAVTSVAGEVVTTYVDKTYNAEKRKRRIAFVYDCTNIPNYLTSLIGEGCTACNKGEYNLNGFVTGRTIKVSTLVNPILANIEGHSDTAGLSVNFNLHCDARSWMCGVRSSLAMPILYRTAEAIMEYADFNSSRFNSKTSINKAQIGERLMKYHEDYTKQLDIALKSIKTPIDGICFTCKPRSASVTTLP
jgi:hypothetical protein